MDDELAELSFYTRYNGERIVTVKLGNYLWAKTEDEWLAFARSIVRQIEKKKKEMSDETQTEATKG